MRAGRDAGCRSPRRLVTHTPEAPVFSTRCLCRIPVHYACRRRVPACARATIKREGPDPSSVRWWHAPLLMLISPRRASR